MTNTEASPRIENNPITHENVQCLIHIYEKGKIRWGMPLDKFVKLLFSNQKWKRQIGQLKQVSWFS